MDQSNKIKTREWRVLESKITKIPNSREIQNGKSVVIWQNQKLKHIKRMDNETGGSRKCCFFNL